MVLICFNLCFVAFAVVLGFGMGGLGRRMDVCFGKSVPSNQAKLQCLTMKVQSRSPCFGRKQRATALLGRSFQLKRFFPTLFCIGAK